ncbi:MAG: nucleotidyltransferase family protein [Pseudobutyrivibrio sp.]|nr:nucleotidyltransferase family protein [Pseudobutyrivibrio sp.]
MQSNTSNKELIDATNGLIYLCRCAINNSIPDSNILKEYNIDQIFEIARKHMLCSIAGIALESAGIHNQSFQNAVAASTRKIIIIDNEKQNVFRELENAGIWHMSLKGSIIRDWYPKFAMRESADCDILFDKNFEETVKQIMIRLGYSVESYGNGHHDVYYKKPLTNMQMHVALFGPGFENRLNDYYDNIESKLLKGEHYERSFTPEDFYIYFIAHNHRDYSNSGIGLRSVLDTYVILKRFNFDWDYIERETHKLQISKFEEENRMLSLHLFDNTILTQSDKDLLEYMINSGIYGNIDNFVSNNINKEGGGAVGKIRYCFSRLFLPMDVIKHAFPTFYKHKILIPFLPIYRIIKGIKYNNSKLKNELISVFKNK